MRPSAYPRQNRSPSFHNDTSPCSSAAPNDFFVSQKMDYIEHFLSKFDDRLAKLELTAKSPKEDRSFSSHKKTTDTSYTDIDHKLRVVEDGLFYTKNETSKRLSTLEDHIRDLTKKATYGASRLPESREEQGNVHEKIMSIERRVDGMDRRLDQLTSTLESFMQRIEGSLAGSMRQNGRRESRHHETEEGLTEVKLLGASGVKDTYKRSEETYHQIPRRTASRDPVVVDMRDRMREIPDQSGSRRQEEVKPLQQEKPVERPQRNERNDRNDRNDRTESRRSVDVRAPTRDSSEQPERKREEIVRHQERPVERPLLDLRAPPRDVLRETKGGLRSPDTERKRKNVSWCEAFPSDANVDLESPQKRTKVETYEGEIDNGAGMRRSSLGDSMNGKERERPRSAIKPREKVEERYRLESSKVQRTPSVAREEAAPYEKYMRYTGESRLEGLESTMEKTVEKTEERERESVTVGNDNKVPENKERMFEERRKKIDEEIERRIGKQIEMKKKNDVAVEGQKKIYEKASQIEDEFKISPYSTEKSRDKEVVSRLVREKQMRSDLISKYSETAPDSSRKSKSPLRK